MCILFLIFCTRVHRYVVMTWTRRCSPGGTCVCTYMRFFFKEEKMLLLVLSYLMDRVSEDRRLRRRALVESEAAHVLALECTRGRAREGVHVRPRTWGRAREAAHVRPRTRGRTSSERGSRGKLYLRMFGLFLTRSEYTCSLCCTP